MINIKTVTAKNFLSIGNVIQSVDFSKEHLTLVLGENLDLGGDSSGSRNGVGKTAILNALSYALYGQALTNIKKDNLINHINGKNMIVTVEFEKDGSSFRIERGRKPNVLKFFINDKEKKEHAEENDSQGDSRETQKFIDNLLGMSHMMFKHILALNTYTEPFLSMKVGEQREIIEQLLGITLLSEKAEALKAVLKETKDQIQAEQFKIESIRKANDNVQKSIDSIILKSKAWETKKEDEISKLANSIAHLETVNIEQELKLHEELKAWDEKSRQLRELTKQKSTYESALIQAEKTLNKYQQELEILKDKKCPQCEQELHNGKHEDLISKANKNFIDATSYLETVANNIGDLTENIKTIQVSGPRPETFYDTEAEALGHKNNLENLEKVLSSKVNEENPYDDQIEELKKTAIQEIAWELVNELTTLKDHQDFLLKLLTNKDSFIRKRIIDQNLNYLNKRLTYYLDSLGLPHKVTFQNDLGVEITYFGQDLDFDNLSRGERNRLILSISFAFRDVWESLYQNINLLFVDELIDSGMDGAGVEAGLSLLKKIGRERSKNVFLISHKEELISRVPNVLRVIKENGFSSFSNDLDYVKH